MTAPARTGPANDLYQEDFEVYRSGYTVSLLCRRCRNARHFSGHLILTALVDEAAAHAEACVRRPS